MKTPRKYPTPGHSPKPKNLEELLSRLLGRGVLVGKD
jgi:hypothetical protein